MRANRQRRRARARLSLSLSSGAAHRPGERVSSMRGSESTLDRSAIATIPSAARGARSSIAAERRRGAIDRIFVFRGACGDSRVRALAGNVRTHKQRRNQRSSRPRARINMFCRIMRRACARSPGGTTARVNRRLVRCLPVITFLPRRRRAPAANNELNRVIDLYRARGEKCERERSYRPTRMIPVFRDLACIYILPASKY